MPLPVVQPGRDGHFLPVNDFAAYQTQLERLVPLLAAGSGRDRLAAALLAFSRSDTADSLDHAAIVGLALADGGRDAELARAGLLSCADWEDCPREQLLEVTDDLAGRDAALQLLRLSLVGAERRESLWQAMNAAVEFSDGFRSRLALVLEATESLGGRQQGEASRAIHAFALAAATGMPAYQTILRRCPPSTQVDAGVQQCRHVALLMSESTSVLEAQIGLRVLMGQALPAVDQQALREQLRQLQWQSQLASRRVDTAPDYAHQVVVLGEREAIRQLLRRLGLPLVPPPGWQPGAAAGY